jgi:hypothetical protein
VQTVLQNPLPIRSYLDDFPMFPLANIWEDIAGIKTRTEGKICVGQKSNFRGLVTIFLRQHGNNNTND